MSIKDGSRVKPQLRLRATAQKLEEGPRAAVRRNLPAARGKKKADDHTPREASSLLSVRLLESERNRAALRAGKAGLTLSTYARACMLGPATIRAQRTQPINVAAAARVALELLRVCTRLNDLVGMLETSGEKERDDLVSLLRPDIAATLSAANDVLGQAKDMFLSQRRGRAAEDEDS